MRYKNLSEYFRNKYGKRVKKICIDGGFSCPNRDGTCGFGGCIYCGERGAGEHIDATLSITEQVKTQLSGASPDDIFLAYFQNFSNTYASVATLKERYDAALIDERIKLLSIGTRPDCITEEIAELLATYQDTHEVWVELGLQTANDETADIINRGYHIEVFERALAILEKFNIKTVVHLIIGLPGEGHREITKTAEYLRDKSIFGIKIHSLYVMEGTALEKMYEDGEYVPISFEAYVSEAAFLIAKLNPDIVLHRITGDCPKELLVAPDWNRDKNAVISAIQKRLEDENLYQGALY